MVWDLPLLEIEKTDIPEPDGTLAVNTAASPGGNSPLLWSLENRPHSADFTDRSHEHNTCPADHLPCLYHCCNCINIYNSWGVSEATVITVLKMELI